jgi:16S rRNA (adenine1518-N6/adenine1519-N6)-dimethyltransferase
VLVQYYAKVKMGFTIPPGAFRPPPKVDSAVIRLDWIPDVADAPEFTDFVHRIFGERRKKLVNNLRRVMPEQNSGWIREQLGALDIAADARPGELSVEQFLRVYNQVGRH